MSATGANEDAFAESFQPSLSNPFSKPSTSRVLRAPNQLSKHAMTPRTVCPPAAEIRCLLAESIAE